AGSDDVPGSITVFDGTTQVGAGDANGNVTVTVDRRMLDPGENPLRFHFEPTGTACTTNDDADESKQCDLHAEADETVGGATSNQAVTLHLDPERTTGTEGAGDVVTLHPSITGVSSGLADDLLEHGTLTVRSGSTVLTPLPDGDPYRY